MRFLAGALAANLVLAGCSGDNPSAFTVNSVVPVIPVIPDNPANPITIDAEFEALFDLGDIKTIRIRISEEEWNGLLSDFDQNSRSEIYRRADFLFGANPATAVRMNNVGFRVRGNSFSRLRPEVGSGSHRADNKLHRSHFKIKFNERFNDDESAYGPPARDIAEINANRGRLFRGVRSLNLKQNRLDRTYVREVFSQDVFYRFGLKAARWAFTRLYIQIGNERERYMGVFQMGESLDESWVDRHYDDDAFLFKSLYQQFGAADLDDADSRIGRDTGSIGIEITDPEFFGESWNDYRPSYDLKTVKDDFPQAEGELNKLISLLKDNPTLAQLEANLDIPSILKSQAIEVFIGKWDGYWRNGNNYYLLQHPSSRKWVYVPYDNDLVFMDDFIEREGSNDLTREPFVNFGRKMFSESNDPKYRIDPILMERLLSINKYRDMYLEYVRQLVDPQDGLLSPANARARLAAIQAVIAPHTSGYDADSQDNGYFEFRRGINEIMDFINVRAATARAELDASATTAGP